MTCGICGSEIKSAVPTNWHPGRQAQQARGDLEAHLATHSFAELLRFEIRQDLEQVPEEERAMIVRDIYRNLLGRQTADQYALDDADSRGVYSIQEALGDLQIYQLWRTAARCGDPRCAQHAS